MKHVPVWEKRMICLCLPLLLVLWMMALTDFAEAEYDSGAGSLTEMSLEEEISFLRQNAARDDAMMTRIKEIVSENVQSGMSDYDKALVLHDWVIDHLEYVKDDATTSSDLLDEALWNGKAVCQGYTELYQLLLTEAGITNATEVGTDHAWNMIELNGTWYHVDCTWDDGDEAATFFCLPNDVIEKIPNHECFLKTHVGHDYTQAYLYKSGLLDRKINNITSNVQARFDMGIGTFFFMVNPSLISANGHKLVDPQVERYLVEMVLKDTTFRTQDQVIPFEFSIEGTYLYITADVPEVTDDSEFDTNPDHFRIGDYGDVVALLEYTGSATRVRIPDGVTAIYSAFANNDTLREVYIPDSVTTMYRGFYRCSSLQKVRMSQGMKDMSYAFEYDQMLESIILPEGLEEIGDGSFCGCTSLKEAYIPSTVKIIGRWAFAECPQLAMDVVIPGGVEEIDYLAFGDDILITSVVIEEGVKSIGEGAFSGCSALKELSLPDTLVSIGKSAFFQCGALKMVELPAGLQVLGGGAFSDCDSLREITISPNITSLEVSLFSRCGALQKVNLPDKLERIETYAFFRNNNLSKLLIPYNVNYIADDAFEQSTATVLVVYPNSYALSWAVEHSRAYEIFDIQKHMDWDLILPQNLVTIESDAFAGVQAASVFINRNTRTIHSGAFAGCPNLVRVYIPASVQNIAPDAFAGEVMIYGRAGTAAEDYAKERGLVFVVVE